MIKMKVCILMGSMKKSGNTAALIEPLKDQLEVSGIEYEYIWLKDFKLEECKGCFTCQSIDEVPGCSINDEMNTVFKSILSSDCIIFASPIYTWFCTSSMKIVLDRLFSMNKYYGNTETNYTLMQGKKYAVVSTCGNELETGVDLFEKAVIRLAEQSEIEYIGILAARDINGISDFETSEVVKQAKEFGKTIVSSFNKPLLQ